MNPERWNQVRDLFEEALDLTPEQWPTWLEQVCGQDQQLRSEVEALLRADGRAQDFLERSALEPLRLSPLAEELERGTVLDDGVEERFLAGTVVVERYRIVYLLGRGGMGEVYRAEDLRLKSSVALKLLPSTDQARLQAFLGELKLARRVTHPNVCRVYDLVEAEEGIFLSMEFVEGDDLSSLLRRIGRLSPSKALEVTRQLASGLAAIHQQGILHRDLKPANVILDQAGEVKIMDFGIASLAQDPKSRRYRGTPAYMAPEQLAGGGATIQTDLYSMGRVAYEIFTGQTLASGKHTAGQIISPSQFVADLDPEVERLVVRCLATDPHLRPESAVEIEKALASRAQGLQADGDRTIWRPTAGDKLPRRAHWQLERRLSRGGFGDVWLATHIKTSEPRVFKFCDDIRRLQALKREVTIYRLLKESLGVRSDISRILDWNFDHPPYFIEAAYTDGGSLASWVGEQGGLAEIPLSLRIEIIAQVATALAAAHSVGVLHQDIKPGNVLIATDGEGNVQARLSDFGIGEIFARERLSKAGITELGFTEWTEQVATEGSIHGTRFYMAPELLEGKPATVQADLYALGVMFYQIVTGDFSRALGPGWERDVDDEVLREDIAQLVDRAPERRSGDAQGLADRLRNLEDRRRELEDRRREAAEAMQARADLLVARRRRNVALVAILMLLVFASMVVLHSHRVQQEAQTTKQVSNFLIDLFEVSDPNAEWAGDLSARQILDLGAQRIEVELQGQPRVQSRLMVIMARVFTQLGLFEDAMPLAERSLEIRRQLFGEEHLEVADSLSTLAEISLEKGDYERAETLGLASLDLRLELLGNEHVDVATSLEILARSHAFTGRPDAEELFRQALAIRLELQDPEEPEVIASQRWFGLFLMDRGRYEEAEVLFQELLESQQSRLGPDHPSQAVSLNKLALIRQFRGDFEGAEELFERALEIRRRFLGSEHPHIGPSLSHLAFLYESKGEFERAEATYREELDLYRRVIGDHPNTALTLDNLARLNQTMGRYAEAESLLREALEMRRRLHGEQHPEVGESLNKLGFVLITLGEYERAADLHRAALSLHQDLLGADSDYTASSLLHLGVAQQLLGEKADAADSLRQSVEVYRRTLGEDHYALAYALTLWAGLLLEEGRVDEAEPQLEEALKIARRALPSEHWRIALVESARGAWLALEGEHEAAESLLLDALRQIQQQKGKRSLYARWTLQRLIDLYEATGENVKVETYRALLDETVRGAPV